MNRPRCSALPRVLLCLLLALVIQATPASALQGASFAANALPASPGEVIELLRLRVPGAAREAWLEAERRTWEPWLQAQSGFLGRQLLWDPDREEGVLLIHWASRQQWKAIGERDVDQVQRRFESEAAALAGDRGGHQDAAEDANPFPLLHAGELQPLASTPVAPPRSGGAA